MDTAPNQVNQSPCPKFREEEPESSAKAHPCSTMAGEGTVSAPFEPARIKEDGEGIFCQYVLFIGLQRMGFLAPRWRGSPN